MKAGNLEELDACLRGHDGLRRSERIDMPIHSPRKLIAPALLGLAIAAAAPSVHADALQRLQDYARDTKTLSGSFTQVVYDRAGRKTQDSGGEMYFARPGKFRWVYRKPYEQLIVGDGRKIWIYDADLEQVTVKKQDQAIGESPAALLAGSSDLDKHFNLKDAGEKDGLEWLEATPRSEEGTFERIRLGFRENLLVAMELKDNFGQTSYLKFNSLKSNSNLKSDLFRFTPPKGVDVIDQ
jgi:outer membrane lipoprotein carrier protein